MEAQTVPKIQTLSKTKFFFGHMLRSIGPCFLHPSPPSSHQVVSHKSPNFTLFIIPTNLYHPHAKETTSIQKTSSSRDYVYSSYGLSRRRLIFIYMNVPKCRPWNRSHENNLRKQAENKPNNQYCDTYFTKFS